MKGSRGESLHGLQDAHHGIFIVHRAAPPDEYAHGAGQVGGCLISIDGEERVGEPAPRRTAAIKPRQRKRFIPGLSHRAGFIEQAICRRGQVEARLPEEQTANEERVGSAVGQCEDRRPCRQAKKADARLPLGGE